MSNLNETPVASEKSKEQHWADQAAADLIAAHPSQELFTLASGITPSGTVHIGNFRELITVDLVRRALLRKGKKVRFIFSWDDYDVFRKVPANMPEQEKLKEFLGKPIVKTPDPFGKAESYALHHEMAMENSIKKAGIFPEFIYQEKNYRSSLYAGEMKKALLQRKEIASILDQYRKEPLPESWMPVSVFCTNCDKDETSVTSYDNDFSIAYKCHLCKHEETIDLRKTSAAKLLWRVDWPMRWNWERVDFEPGGKDHSTDGGSFDTAKQIVKKVWNREPPMYLMYDFIRIKGKGGKISSSKGEVVTLDDMLQIYEAEMARYLFASYKSGVEFAISFDLDVIKIYEDYDRLERRYYGKEEVGEEEKIHYRRIYELAQVTDPASEMPFQPAFRHLTNVLQTYEFDFEKVLAFYSAEIKNESDKKRLSIRAACAKNWLEMYAPEDFKFKLRSQPETNFTDPAIQKVTEELINFLKAQSVLEENAIAEQIQKSLAAHSVEMGPFFKAMYQAIVGKDRGPKLAGFIVAIGKDRILPLLGA
jgi:lysyl-tRNA synthetase class 1